MKSLVVLNPAATPYQMLWCAGCKQPRTCGWCAKGGLAVGAFGCVWGVAESDIIKISVKVGNLYHFKQRIEWKWQWGLVVWIEGIVKKYLNKTV